MILRGQREGLGGKGNEGLGGKGNEGLGERKVKEILNAERRRGRRLRLGV